jgi:hypothetical protein
MAAKYGQAETDTDLLSLHSEVALVDARLADLLTRVDTGESGALWDQVKKTYEEFALYRRMPGHVNQMTSALEKLTAVIERALTDHAAWAEIGEKLEQRRKLVESENKIMLARKYFISHEQGMIMMGKITDSVTRHALELLPIELSRKFLTAVTVDLQQMMGQDPSETPVYSLAATEDEA